MDALRFITCGSVDDGKSTLIGRLLYDSRALLHDQVAALAHAPGQPASPDAAAGNAAPPGSAAGLDLARLTDGLSAEREQGITIDVAYRYFSSARRKFIIGDAPGHEQYTRNMVTAASSADAAVLLVDATKLDWQRSEPTLLPQTRRHALLCQLLRVPHLVFAVNKLDAVPDPALAYARIESALRRFAQQAGLALRAVLPLSALQGWNVVQGHPNECAAAPWCGYPGATLLELLEQLPSSAPETEAALALPVQWVEKPAPGTERRIYWGRVARGRLRAGDEVQIFPGAQRSTVLQVLDHARCLVSTVAAGHSAGVVLAHERDLARGDWLLAAQTGLGTHTGAGAGAAAAAGVVPMQRLRATLAWLDDAPLQLERSYWALHQQRWVKARVRRIEHRLNIQTLAQEPAQQLEANSIGSVELLLNEPLPLLPYAASRALGALILVDCASHRTAAAVLVDPSD